MNEPILECRIMGLTYEMETFSNAGKITRFQTLNAGKTSKIIKITDILGSGSQELPLFKNMFYSSSQNGFIYIVIMISPLTMKQNVWVGVFKKLSPPYLPTPISFRKIAIKYPLQGLTTTYLVNFF